MGLNEIESLSKEMQELQADIRAEESAYKRHILDLSLPINEPKFLFSIGGIPTIPSGELIGIKGRAKQGKSQYEYILISAMLSGMEKVKIKPLKADYKVLLFDTEQSQASLKKCCQRALDFANLPKDNNDSRFLPFFLRPLSINDRRRTIEDAIKAEQPTIIFIDGIRDLLQDFNNLAQSNELIQWLLSLTAEHGCTIVSVLHQNKSKEDGNMRGHLGTELLNKLADCFEVSKKDGKFVITCTDSRNVPCRDTAFSIDAEGKFKEESTTIEDKGRERVEEIKRVLRLCFSKTHSLSYGELVESYALEDASSESTAKRRINEAKKNNFIIAGSNGKYTLNPGHA